MFGATLNVILRCTYGVRTKNTLPSQLHSRDFLQGIGQSERELEGFSTPRTSTPSARSADEGRRCLIERLTLSTIYDPVGHLHRCIIP